MVGCFPCGKLAPAASNLNQCYPPSKQLVAAGPDYKPLSEDLSNLIYFAVNKPAQLAKIGVELETRVTKEARGSSGGYAKSRASLLISLSILKSLNTECKRDLALFSRSALRCIVLSLDVKVYQKGGPDLEVIGRAAGCFTAFATSTDGGPFGVDDTVTRDYLAALTRFGRMAVYADQGMSEKPDMGTQSRARLIGLASLCGAAGSDALFLSDTDFARQADIIIPSLLSNLFDAPFDELKSESGKIHTDTSTSPFFSEFSVRRPLTGRAPSIYADIRGEKGPSASDVLSAALRSLKALVAHRQLNRASMVLEAVFGALETRVWGDVERCCWLTEELAKFTSHQCRFAIPTRLVELLADIPDTAPSAKQSTVLAMIHIILNSPAPLVGLPVSDILGDLLSLIIRRIHINERDSLLPPLVHCVAALGTHILYADQINDIIADISQRIAEIPTTDKHRPEILRVLIHCMTNVMRVVHVADDREAAQNPPVVPVSADKGKGPQTDSYVEPIVQRATPSRRNAVAPQVWQETLPLLCESSYAVRAVYARALLLFLQREMPREGGSAGSGDPAAARFCSALHAAVYTLAMSACLGSAPAPASDDSPAISNRGSPVQPTNKGLPEMNGEKDRSETGKGVSFNITEPTPSETPNTSTPPNGQRTPPRKARRASRRVSLPLNRLNSSTFTTLASFDNVATPLDFAYIVKILDTLHSVVPGVALMTGGPMLFALDAAAGSELVRRAGDGRSGAWVLERKRGVREAVGLVWRSVGRKWDVGMVEELAEKTLLSLPEPNVIPTLYAPDDSDILPPPDEPLSFMQNMIEGESSSASQPLLDSEIIISALASSAAVQKATNRDSAGVVQRLGGGWSVESALKESIERFSILNTDFPTDTTSTNPNLPMSQSNPSYRSFSRSPTIPTRPIDVADLREALGQGQVQTGSAGASFVSTVGTGGRSFVGDGSPRSGMPNGFGGGMSGMRKEDVKEVLKDIFRDKKREKERPAAVVAPSAA